MPWSCRLASTESGQSIYHFNVIDDFNREALGIEVDFLLPSERVIRALDQITARRGKPVVIPATIAQSL